MKLAKITFPTDLEEIGDVSNDNIDVFVELEDGNTYTLVVATPLNIMQLMEKDDLNYLEPGPPMIIVKELTFDTISTAVKAFCEGDAYWLKEYYVSGNFEISILDEYVANMK